MSSKAQSVGLFDRAILRQAVGESFRKLSPRMVAKNPVMFVVEVGSALTTLLVIRDLVVHPPGHAPLWFTGAVSIWLWFTVLFFPRVPPRGPRPPPGRDPPQDAQGDHGPTTARRGQT
jgi:high-affinity K+ transport system ATPase subunit B